MKVDVIGKKAKRVAGFSVSIRPGNVRFALDQKALGRRIGRGSYRLEVSAVDVVGNASPKASVGFRVR